MIKAVLEQTQIDEIERLTADIVALGKLSEAFYTHIRINGVFRRDGEAAAYISEQLEDKANRIQFLIYQGAGMAADPAEAKEI